jgi:RNA polymerase sigma-70 factor (ECF subfamily)
MNRTLDLASFESLFRNEFKGLVLYALRYVKDYETARGIVQDAFVSLWEKRETIDPTRSILAYLSASVRNKSLNHIRDTRKFSNDLLTWEQLLPDQGYEQIIPLDIMELETAIDRAIGILPEKCREVFELSRKEHLKYQEIADRLHISVKTVESQMSKALQYMRIHLKEFLMILLFLLSG